MLHLQTRQSAPNSSKVTVKSHSTEMLQREQTMRGKEHWPPKCVIRPPFSLFTCLATMQQRLVTSLRDPGVVSLHVNAGQFSTTARRVTSPTWGPPPPCKQALNVRIFSTKFEGWSKYFSPFKLASLRKLVPSCNAVCTGACSIRMAQALPVKYLSAKTPVADEKCWFYNRQRLKVW